MMRSVREELHAHMLGLSLHQSWNIPQRPHRTHMHEKHPNILTFATGLRSTARPKDLAQCMRFVPDSTVSTIGRIEVERKVVVRSEEELVEVGGESEDFEGAEVHGVTANSTVTVDSCYCFRVIRVQCSVHQIILLEVPVVWRVFARGVVVEGLVAMGFPREKNDDESGRALLGVHVELFAEHV